jgi:hypothetical protein
MKMSKWIAAAALLLAAAPVQGQQRDWTAWQGCWQGIGLDVPAGEMLCILPGDDASTVRFATVSGDRIVSETAVRADGVARAVEEGGCKGTQSATFSADGRRIYTRSDMDCGTGTIKRVNTGAIAMVNSTEWIDVQSLTVAGQHATRTARYQAVASSRMPESIAAQLPDRRLAQETARMQASAPMTTDQVVEASKAVAPPVVEALLAARQQGFKLGVNTLKDLKAAGVATSTIDVMIALSYPQHFAVQERPATQYATSAPRGDAYDDFDCDYSSMFGSRRYVPGCNTGYGYGRYGYSPYSNYYNNYGYNSWYGGRDPIIVVINPADEADGGGAVVKGTGYTKGTSSTSSSSPRPSSTASSSSAGSKATPTTGSSTGSTSTGSSSSSSGRTAKPRGGG